MSHAGESVAIEQAVAPSSAAKRRRFWQVHGHFSPTDDMLLPYGAVDGVFVSFRTCPADVQTVLGVLCVCVFVFVRGLFFYGGPWVEAALASGTKLIGRGRARPNG